jgi:putative addiction module killer protein
MNRIQTTHVFDEWFDALADRMGKARIQARIDRAESGNFGDCAPVGEGVSEMRIHSGPGYRIYFRQRGNQVFVLMVGGNKASQSRDIQTALQMARSLGD